MNKLSPLIERESESSMASNTYAMSTRIDAHCLDYPDGFMTAVGRFENAAISQGQTDSSFKSGSFSIDGHEDNELHRFGGNGVIGDVTPSRSGSTLSVHSGNDRPPRPSPPRFKSIAGDVSLADQGNHYPEIGFMKSSNESSRPMHQNSFGHITPRSVQTMRGTPDDLRDSSEQQDRLSHMSPRFEGPRPLYQNSFGHITPRSVQPMRGTPDDFRGSPAQQNRLLHMSPRFEGPRPMYQNSFGHITPRGVQPMRGTPDDFRGSPAQQDRLSNMSPRFEGPRPLYQNSFGHITPRSVQPMRGTPDDFRGSPEQQNRLLRMSPRFEGPRPMYQNSFGHITPRGVQPMRGIPEEFRGSPAQGDRLSHRSPSINGNRASVRSSPNMPPKNRETPIERSSMLPSSEQIEAYFKKSGGILPAAPAQASPRLEAEGEETSSAANSQYFEQSQAFARTQQDSTAAAAATHIANVPRGINSVGSAAYEGGPMNYQRPPAQHPPMQGTFVSGQQTIPQEIVYNELLGPEAFQDKLIDIDFAAIEIANMRTSEPTGLIVKNAYRSPQSMMTESRNTVFPQVQYYLENSEVSQEKDLFDRRYEANNQFVTSSGPQTPPRSEYHEPAANSRYMQENYHINVQANNMNSFPQQSRSDNSAHMDPGKMITSDVFGNTISDYNAQEILRISGANNVIDRLSKFT